MNLSKLTKKNKYIIISVLILLIVGSAAFFISSKLLNSQASSSSLPSEQTSIKSDIETLSLTPLDNDSTGVAVSSSLLLMTSKKSELDPEDVKNNIKITPSTDFEISKHAEGFLIKPKSKLIPNKVYSVKLSLPEQNVNESWAFQTRRSFKIVGTLPRQRANNVPVDSGIEITFSHQDIKEFEKHFKIEPQVNGKFEYHKNVAVFAPERLEYGTVYTVTIGKEVYVKGSKQALQEDYTFQFQTASKEEKQQQSYIGFSDICNNQPSDAAPNLGIYMSEDILQQDLEVTVYKYKDEDRFIKDYMAQFSDDSWAQTNMDQMKNIDIKTLDQAYTFNTKAIRVEEPYYSTFLPFPEALSEGYYLVDVKSGEINTRTLLQINDMQVYMTADKNSSIIWINDMISGTPVAGANVDLESRSIGRSDTSGLLSISENIFNNKEKSRSAIKIERDGHPSFISILNSYQNYYYSMYDYESTTDKSSWNYMYLDRSTYLPNDKINVWGVIKPRNGTEPPQSITLNLYVYEYAENADEPLKDILDTKEIPVNKFGTYMGSFEIKDLPSRSYHIEAVLGDKVISDKYFDVNKYKKPQYVLKVTPNERCYFQGETTDIDVSCEFFEGTPVANVGVSYSIARDDEQTLKLNTEGKGKIAVTVNNDLSSWQPQYQRVEVRSNNLEETELYNEDYYWAFSRDVAVDLKPTIDKGKVSLSLATNKIDLSKAKGSEYLYDDNGDPIFLGMPVDKDVEITLYEKYWVAKENGQYYDFINKKTVEKYEYDEVNNPISTFVVKTVQGKADYDFTIPNYSDDKIYYIEYKTTDSRNRIILDTNYIYSGYFYDYWNSYQSNYVLSLDQDQYEQDEKIEMNLYKDNERINEVSKGSILYLRLQDGIKECWVSTKGQQIKSFEEEYIPNVYFKAIYFDGRSLSQAYDKLISYNYSKKQLTFDVKTDKESYKPGDTATVNILVKDKKGNPCKAQVNLSVVDEAYFSIYQQYVDISGEIYRNIYEPGITNTYTAYSPPQNIMGNGAEGGEGDDEGSRIRSNFVDSAYFDSIETDDEGKAIAKFKVPDNLTSWRLTYQGITDDLKVGEGKVNINAKLPFFVRAVTNDSFMQGDSPAVLLSGYGTEINARDKVYYEVSLTDNNGVTKNFTTQGKGSEQTVLQLPKLNTGIYQMVIKGRSGEYTDSIERSLDVRESLLSAPKTTYTNLSKNSPIGELQAPYANVLFFNKGVADYYESLTGLYTWGTRLDQVLARKLSGELWKTYFNSDWWFYTDNDIDLSPYQMEDGGLALLTYGSSDCELSAKAAALSPNSFEQYRLIRYFSDIINNTDSTPLQVCASYWGMAALGEPVLLDVQKMIKSKDITIDEKLYLALALAEMGDNIGAKDVFSQVTQRYSKSMLPYRYIDTDGDKDDIMSLTSKIAVLGYKINDTEKQQYLGYVLNNSTDDILLNLERLMIAKIGLPTCKMTGSITLSIDNKEQKLELDGNASIQKLLSKEQVKNMKVLDVKGDIVAAITQSAPVINTSDVASKVAKVTREYNGKTGSNIVLDKTQIVKITLRVNFDEAAPAGYYTLTDTLPAGLHYVESSIEQYDTWYYAEAEGQLVKLGVYHKGGKGSAVLKYYARPTSPGKFIADSAIVTHDESSASGIANRTNITIE